MMGTYKEYDSYDEIPQDVFVEVIEDLAWNNFQNTLKLPGVLEAILEEYNNEALDILCPYPEGEDDD